MKVLLCFAAVVAVAFAAACDVENCKIEDECVCTSRSSPLPLEDTPQFVMLTFDDAVTRYIYDTYYQTLLLPRTNPDNKTIGATFFVPHEYSDYEAVNQLYNAGFEIGTHSITKDLASYWEKASEDTLVQEFKGQKEIIAKFANIPEEHIKGVRTPHFQLAGNKTFTAYVKAGCNYDSSWTSLPKDKLFPYTLDHVSTQECLIGECPTVSVPKFWVAPINDLVGENGINCNTIYGCQKNGTAEEIEKWLLSELEKSYKNRAPMKLLVNSVWLSDEQNLKGFEGFLDAVGEKEDHFLVSVREVIEWMKNPVPVTQYTSLLGNVPTTCDPITCVLDKQHETRYMRSCVPCPRIYPWLNNPTGEVY
ncbi:PREDICTED: uncharacterized protein LOC108561138 [Nicrophorus vespilloides]|uniref:Uncharacterized protein LOC108561138 n=1 Tax=Nicrophorus vespilloides TaxID=110193 RepID=A0ABM1MIN8_NICVS|nr:PREDICTED: uncharacterized protein LOC108561138 [Nicrophorus vespilloides]